MENKDMHGIVFDDAPVDVTTEVNFIWSIANKLRGPYREDKYKDVIIPMVILRRFECALADTKQEVVEAFEANPSLPAKVLERKAGFQFYNTSRFTLAELLNDAANLAANLKDYINGFSANVQEIIMSDKGLKFGDQIDKMDKNDRLFSVVKAFSELDLDPKTIDNVHMGYIFEDLIRRFSENAEAGDHYTGRDIVKLMVNLLLAEGSEDLFDDAKVVTVLDQACGTGGMLSTAESYVKRLNPTADVRLFGQEVNPESYAICLAEMLIKGQDADNIRYQDTFKADCFPDRKMRFVIENPPFGTAWSGKDAAEGVEEAVKAEHAKGMAGRFGAGLPAGGDSQMLFLQSAVDKMDPKVGRAAIVENGSPLFNGGTASGESQIRRWLLENDLIEAIIALPTDLFYNTGIATYIWILSKNKDEKRRGKVQLIDASGISHKLRKSLGNKRNEITPEDRERITRIYAEFKESDLSKIFDNHEFIYREYTVMQPLQRSYAITEKRIDNLIQGNALSSLYDEAKARAIQEKLGGGEKLTAAEQKNHDKYEQGKALYDVIIKVLRENIDDEKWMSPEAFSTHLAEVLHEVTSDRKLLGSVAEGLSVMDKDAKIQRDRKGKVLWDKDTKDTEIVPIDESIDKYMEREVLPYVPDAEAFFEEDLSKKKPVVKTGAEIPFTRYFYKYEQPESSEELKKQFLELEKSVDANIAELFGNAGM